MLLFNIASYDVIGSVDCHVVLRWDLYVVREVCWGYLWTMTHVLLCYINMNVLS